jgi:radical SAM superfamily enzyme YgiQ (UPF0313 family)
MKILISFPPLKGKGCPMLGQNRQFQWFHNPSFIYPMVPASAATLLQSEGHKVIWNDCIAEKWEYEEFIDFFKKEKPDLIALETKTPVVRQHWRIVDELKSINPNCVTVLMGDHITAKPAETMKNSKVDFCLTGGDYDFLLSNIVKYLEKKVTLEPGIWYRAKGEIKDTGKFELNHDLNTLPLVDRELTKWRLYGERLYKREPFTYTMVGRDCPWAKCKFCSWTTLFPKFRTRSPKSLLDEIGMLIEKYNIGEIFDDTGTFPSGKWLTEFCNGMIERGYNKKIYISCNFRYDYLTLERAKLMKKAGFRLMKCGLESASDDTLKRLDKGTTVAQIIEGSKIAKQAGLTVHLTMMVGYPWETKEDMLNTLKLARYLMLNGYADMLQSTVIMSYPGTPLYEEAVENDWLKIDKDDYEQFDMCHPILKTPDTTEEEIMKVCHDIYKIFLHPRFILHHLLKIRDFEYIRYLGRGIKPVIGHIRDFVKVRK